MLNRALPPSLLLTALVSLAGSPDAVAAQDHIHLVDVSELVPEEIDTVFALPSVDAWLELGNTALLVGDGGLERELASLGLGTSSWGVRGDRDALRLGRAHSCAPSASPRYEPHREGARLLASPGRYRLLLVEDASAHPDSIPVPWNTAVIRRADRRAAQEFAATGAGLDDPLVDEAVLDFDPEAYWGVVSDLVGFGTRYTPVASFPDVTDYFARKLDELGLDPTLEPFTVSGKTRHNVIVELPGTVTPEDVYVICGHYDSISQTPSTYAPGADDNASGAAAVIEIARVLSRFQFDSTIRFIGFAGEEQGLVGSYAHVNSVKNAGELGRVKGVINMDMIAYLNIPRLDVLIEGGAGTSSQMMSLLSSLVSQHTTLTAFTSTNPFGSDHMPYINNGVNAVLTIEYQDGANPNYHRTSDTLSTLSLPLATEIVKLNIAGLATSAGINGYSTRAVVAPYGTGLAGSNVGSLDSASPATIGTTLVLDASGFDDSTFVNLVYANDRANVAGWGGTVLIDLGGVLGNRIAAVSGGAATIQFALPPNPDLVGRTAHMQCGADDPTQAQGIALSNGLTVTIGL